MRAYYIVRKYVGVFRMSKTNKKAKGSIRSLLLSALILVICVSLSACKETSKSCSAELDSLLADTTLPVGETYICGAEEGGSGYLSPETARALYGEGADEILSLCEDFAIFLSGRPNPFEAAVFRCYSRSDAERIAKMLLERIADVKISLRNTSLAGAYDTAYVEVHGRTVIMRGGVQNTSK